MLKLCKCKSRR